MLPFCHGRACRALSPGVPIDYAMLPSLKCVQSVGVILPWKIPEPVVRWKRVPQLSSVHAMSAPPHGILK